MEETDLQALERFVVENEDLLALEEQIGRFNIFDALGIARVEVRHSNFLAWLLTPGESHGQGDLFLKSLLMDMLRKARKQEGLTAPFSPIELDGADLHEVEIRREWRNIDMLVICDEPKFVVAVENKVDSGEHSDQLNRYERIVTSQFPEYKPLFVFLTPTGETASDTDWLVYSYADLHAVFSRARRINAGAIGGDVAVFLEHYLSLIGNRFMENEDIDRLCRQIYANHRRAIDLIQERVGSPTSALSSRIEEWIKEHTDRWMLLAVRQREIEVIPKAWANMLPPVGKRKNLDARHWLTIMFHLGRRRMHLWVIVSPTTDLSVRKTTLERVLRDKSEFGFATFFKKKELTTDWTRVYSEEICSLPEDEEPDVEAIMPKIEKHLAELEARTNGLPTAMAALFASP